MLATTATAHAQSEACRHMASFSAEVARSREDGVPLAILLKATQKYAAVDTVAHYDFLRALTVSFYKSKDSPEQAEADELAICARWSAADANWAAGVNPK